MPNTESFHLQEEFLIIGAAAKSGLFDIIRDNPQTLDELLNITGSTRRALWTVIEALVEMDYLEWEGDKIQLTGSAFAIFYDKADQRYTGFSFMHSYDLISIWLELPDLLRPVKPDPEQEDKAYDKNFITAMGRYAGETAFDVADFCFKELCDSPRVLDVGGGPLTMAHVFAQKGAHVTVLDLPHVVDMMAAEVDGSLAVQMVKGDFTAGLPAGPFDLVYLGNICHIYGEKENRKLLRDCAGVLRNGGRLVINDFIRGIGTRPAVFAVNMLLNTESGGTWTYEQYKEWLQDAGFNVFPVREINGDQLISATLSLLAKH